MKALYIVPIAVMVTILQGCYPEPTANFEFSYSDNTAPAEITFINKSTEAESYRWEFGDGDISTEKAPVHTFTQAGTYTVALMAKGRGGESQTTRNVTITQPTTYIVRNLSSITLYEVKSFYHNGTEIEAYYEHGTMTPNTMSVEVITEHSPLQLYFELADGATCIAVDSYPMISRTLNYMDFDDDTYYYYEYPAKKSASVSPRKLTPDDIQRIRESGKTGQLKDLMK